MLQTRTQASHRQAFAIVSLLTPFAVLVQGFHPYAEDGGLYVAGIKKLLDPSLYAARPEFVVAPLRFSPFAPAIAAIVRWTHVPLPWVLLAVYCASVWATLMAGWTVISRCTESLPARCGAVTLLACWLTIPIAGTSLMLLDPYVTARSISTPCTLFAVAWAMDAAAGSRRGSVLCALALVVAAVHPLMAGYGLAAVIALFIASAEDARLWRWGFAIAGVIAFAGLVQLLAPAESPQYIRAEMTRLYWFPFHWQWYELFGLAAPLLLLSALRRGSGNLHWQSLAWMAIALGAISVVVALSFSRVGLATHLVARMQPLRCFQLVYEAMILLLGAWTGERWLQHNPWRWSFLLAVLGGVMFFAQRNTYPASRHFELPGLSPRNRWSQAFLWIRDNTPKDALFAIDPHYITRDGEDAQSFRAIAERSVLPDFSKDGGETSVTPALADAWAAGQSAQAGLDAESDSLREARLKSLGVGWVVLMQSSQTTLSCPYTNGTVKVCSLP